MMGPTPESWFPALRRTPWVLPLCLASWLAAAPASALGPGERAPSFELPRLRGGGSVYAPDLFFASRLTALVFWNRGCPECTEVAMGMQALADSLAPLGAQVVGVAFGPDDPFSIRDQLREHGISARQLWDAGAGVATRYGLGLQHLSVFLIDETARVRAVFDDRIRGLVDPVLPAARRILAGETESATEQPEPEAASAAPETTRPVEGAPVAELPSVASALSVLKLDARMKLLSTEKARSGDRGLFNETLVNGVLHLYRYDIRLPWTPVAGVEFVPWLRVSNEDEEILTEGAEQITSARVPRPSTCGAGAGR